MRITVSQLRRIIKEETTRMLEAGARGKIANRVAYDPRKPWGESFVLEELLGELGLSSPEQIQFGRGRTPVGMKMMAGSSEQLTHFWDVDGGWQPMPTPYMLGV